MKVEAEFGNSGDGDVARLHPSFLVQDGSTQLCARAIAAHNKTDLNVGRMRQPAIKLAIACGKRMVKSTTTAATQNSATLTGLRLLH